MTKPTNVKTIRSGWCGIHAGPASHRMCAGSYGGYDCRCDCHRQEGEPVDQLEVQVAAHLWRISTWPVRFTDEQLHTRARTLIALVRAADK